MAAIGPIPVLGTTGRDAINLRRAAGLAPISRAFRKKTYKQVSGEANMRAEVAEIVGELSPTGGDKIVERSRAKKHVNRLERVSLDTVLWILGGFSNDYGRLGVERWSAEEDARLITYYRMHSVNGRLGYEAMTELKLKFRNRSKPALYGRICELRKAGRLRPSTGYSIRPLERWFEPPNHTATLAPTSAVARPDLGSQASRRPA